MFPKAETCNCQQPFEDEAEQARFGNLERTAALWLGEEPADIPKRASSKKKTASTQRVIATLDDLLYAEPFDPNNEERPAHSLMKGLVEGPIEGGSHETGDTAGPQNKVADEITSDDQVAPKADDHKDTFQESTQEEGGQLSGPQNIGEPPNINAMREQVEVVDEMDKHKSITNAEDEIDSKNNKEKAIAAAELVPAEEEGESEVIEAPIGSGKIVINITAAKTANGTRTIVYGVGPDSYRIYTVENGEIVDEYNSEPFNGEAPDQITQYAENTAREMAEEYGVPPEMVDHDHDIDTELEDMHAVTAEGDAYNVEPITSGMTNGNFGGHDSVLIDNPKEAAGGPTPVPAAEDPKWLEGQNSYEINRLEKIWRNPNAPQMERDTAERTLKSMGWKSGLGSKNATYTGFQPTQHMPPPEEKDQTAKPTNIPQTPKNVNVPDMNDTKEAATVERPQGTSQDVSGYWNWETYHTDLLIDNEQQSQKIKRNLADNALKSAGGDVSKINVDALANQFARMFQKAYRETKEFSENNAREMPESEWATQPLQPVNWHEIAEHALTEASLEAEYQAGKGVQKTPGITSSKKAADAKEAGFNFWFPGQVLREFYPEVQHEIVDYPNADNHPMIQDVDLEPGKVSQQDAAYTTDRDEDVEIKEAAGRPPHTGPRRPPYYDVHRLEDTTGDDVSEPNVSARGH